MHQNEELPRIDCSTVEKAGTLVNSSLLLSCISRLPKVGNWLEKPEGVSSKTCWKKNQSNNTIEFSTVYLLSPPYFLVGHSLRIGRFSRVKVLVCILALCKEKGENICKVHQGIDLK